MRQIIVTGCEGMLGRAVVRHLESGLGIDFIAYNRKAHQTQYGLDISDLNAVMQMSKKWADDAVIINCAGLTEPRWDYDALAHTNGQGPHNLARTEHRVLQVSTDCVFAGTAGPYVEADTPDPSDAYAQTKLLGELPTGINLTVRCSFIGLGQRGLAIWVLSQPWGATIEAYMTHIWTGMYAGTLARSLVYLALSGQAGIAHLPGPLAYKGTVVRMIAERFRPDLNVVDTFPPLVNRSLHSQGPYRVGGLSWITMLDEMSDDIAADLVKGIAWYQPRT